jgi:hypothetical protein
MWIVYDHRELTGVSTASIGLDGVLHVKNFVRMIFV